MIMSKMNIFRKFSNRTTFLNAGLLLASLFLLAKHVFANSNTLDYALINPIICFSASSIITLYALIYRNEKIDSFSKLRDCVPILIFPAALLLAGYRETWIWLLFAIASISSLIFYFSAGRYDEIDDEDDKISIKWPF